MDCGCERRKEKLLDWLESRAEGDETFSRDSAATAMDIVVPTLGLLVLAGVVAYITLNWKVRKEEK